MVRREERAFDMREIEVKGVDYLVVRHGNVIGKAPINKNLHVIGEVEFIFAGDEMAEIEGYKMDGEQQKGVEFSMVEIMRDTENIREYMDSRRPRFAFDFE